MRSPKPPPAPQPRRKNEAMPHPMAKVFPATVTDVTRKKDLLRAGIAREAEVVDDNGKVVMIGKRNPKPKTEIVTIDEDGIHQPVEEDRVCLGHCNGEALLGGAVEKHAGACGDNLLMHPSRCGR